MNKQEFIEKLRHEVEKMPQDVRTEILADYEEHFAAGLESGKTEYEIAEKLGDPALIAKEFKNYDLIKKAEVEKNPYTLSRAVLAVIGLSFFNLIFVVGPFFGILGVLFGLVVSSIALVGSGIAGVVLVLASPYIPSVELGASPIAAILLSLSVSSFGIFFSIVTYYLSVGFYKLTLAYLKLNLNIITK